MILALFRFVARVSAILTVMALVYMVHLDLQVREQFEGKRWALPSQVYARPLEVYLGTNLKRSDLLFELGLLGYREAARVNAPGTFKESPSSIELQTRSFNFPDGPESTRHVKIHFTHHRVSGIQDLTSETSVSILRFDPVKIGGIYPKIAEDRVLVKYQELPSSLIALLIQTEDKGYFSHFGLSIRGIVRAFLTNIKAGHTVQGGSTLTQQLAKNFYLTKERTLIRKIKEAMVALLLEMHYSKEDILEAYVNEIYLGQDGDRAIHGFGLASHFYFGVPLSETTLAQQAVLVALVRGASFYNPRKNPERALVRRDAVLANLLEENNISEEDIKAATDEPLGIADIQISGITDFPAYMDLIRREIKEDYPEQTLMSEGLSIFTTLDPIVQHIAEETLKNKIQEIEKWKPRHKNKLQGGLVVTRTESGDVLAVVGDRNPRYAGFNRTLDAKRPIGSLVKPAVYLAALQKPSEYTLASVLKDEEIQLPMHDGTLWSPENYTKTSHGDVLLHQALEQSFNQATVSLGLDVGLNEVVEQLKKLGVKGSIPAYPSIVLGTIEMSPFEVAAMYQTFSAGGFRTDLRAIRDVMTADGKTVNPYPLTVKQVATPESIFLLNTSLQNVFKKGTAAGSSDYLAYSVHAAGKTGTTDQLRDSWFAGFTGDYLAVSWLGRDDNQSSSLSGATGALQVWTKLMHELKPKPLKLLKPNSIQYVWIDKRTGALSSPGCEFAEQLPFVDHSIPYARTSCAPLVEEVTPSRGGWRSWFERD